MKNTKKDQDEVIRKGMRAAANGKKRSDNPYPSGSMKAAAWGRGFESEKWFRIGVKAKSDGKNREDCLFGHGTIQRQYFTLGWEEQMKFEALERRAEGAPKGVEQ